MERTRPPQFTRRMTVRQTAELIREGATGDEIRRRVRNGELIRLRRGAYADAGPATDTERHRDLVVATLAQLDGKAALSHFSAASLHDIPVPNGTLSQVWVTRNSGGGGHLSPHLHELKAPLDAGDVVQLAGLPVTSVSRTAVDVARRTRPPYGLAACDRALASGVSPSELTEQVERWPRRPGIARARRGVDLANPLSESFGESFSRWVIWQLGLPMPILQYPVDVHGRRYRSDFGWPELGVLGEFDGRIKYEGVLDDSRSLADVVMAEKRREQDLRSLGWQVTRWGMAELHEPHRLRYQLEAAFRIGVQHRRP